MREPAERPKPPTPRRPAGGGSRRARFALPADPHDERTSERIEAFLEGPVRERRSRPRSVRPEPIRRPRRAIPLDTRPDWDAALRHEDARIARYGRPASILVIDLAVADPAAEDRLAARVGAVIREHARETDRVTRVSRTRFQLLLPETAEVEAAGLAERVRHSCEAWGSHGPGLPVHIASVAAAPTRGGTLADALQDALEQLAG
ncbi:MAG: GGDEF domain-containing protein [Candidatus Limnocylindrales bacterium]